MTEEEKICGSVDYVNKICQNLKEIKKEEFGKLLHAVGSCRRIILVGEGRSGIALLIGIKGIKKRIFHEDDSSWRWRNVAEAATEFERKRGKTLVLINSGSGNTASPKETVEDLRLFIDVLKEKRGQKFLIATVTSHPEAEIAQHCDVALELKGRDDNKEQTSPLESGIIGDQFELASMVLFRMIKEAINNNLSTEETLRAIEKEIKTIGKIIDSYLASKHYQALIKETASRQRIIRGGRGPDKKVGDLTVIRILHINRLVGREAWPTGPLPPPPIAGDILVPISFSGETKSTLQWVETYKKAGGLIFSIVGTKDSTLSKEENSYVFEARIEDFYVRVVFLLSPLAGATSDFERIIPSKSVHFGHF